jgi:hypothetical protein
MMSQKYVPLEELNARSKRCLRAPLIQLSSRIANTPEGRDDRSVFFKIDTSSE